MEYSRELSHETWSEYFDAVNLEMPGAEVSIEIIPRPGRSQIEAGRLALQALTYDRRGDVIEVALARAGRGGTQVPRVLRHIVDRPARVAVDSPVLLAPMTIAVDASDGARTVIRIAREPEPSG
jgi:multidrug efflux pump subunit AcrA (membrane-fusion protein)